MEAQPENLLFYKEYSAVSEDLARKLPPTLKVKVRHILKTQFDFSCIQIQFLCKCAAAKSRLIEIALCGQRGWYFIERPFSAFKIHTLRIIFH